PSLSTRWARLRAASTKAGSFSSTSACKGVLVRGRSTVQTSRLGASKATSDGYGSDRFQYVYNPRRYRSGPLLCTYVWLLKPPPKASASHSPGGWYGRTLGPPILRFNSPLTARALSRIISASRRKRGPRASSRLCG